MKRKEKVLVFLVVAISVILYWPVDTWFLLDDFMAVTYAHHWENVIHDFHGPQYGFIGHTLFWRPLITLSLGIESHLFGGNPFGYHLDNALVHGLNTLLVFLVIANLFRPKLAIRASLLFALHPASAISVIWTVGRVDVHSTFWMLLSMLFILKYKKKEWSIFPSIFTFLLALGTKEMAFSFPMTAFLVSMGFEWIRKKNGFRDSAGRAFLDSIPYGFLLIGVLLLRRGFLGYYAGGFMAGKPDLSGVPEGVFRWLGSLLFPSASPLGSVPYGEASLAIAVGVGLLWLVFLLVGLFGEENRKIFILCLLLYLVSVVPLYSYLGKIYPLTCFRYFYFPLVGLVTIGALQGWTPALLLLLLMAPVHVPLRADFARAMDFTRAVHLNLLEVSREMPGDTPLVVRSREPDTGMAFKLQIGLESMLYPPFTKKPRVILRWRPYMLPDAGPETIPIERIRFPLPWVLYVHPDGSVTRQKIKSPEMEVFSVITRADKKVLDAGELNVLALDEKSSVIFTSTGKKGFFRIVWLTPQGYLVVYTESDGKGNISLKDCLMRPVSSEYLGTQALFYVALSLNLSPEPVAYLMVHRVDPSTRVPIARADRLLKLRFTREGLALLVGVLKS